MPKVFYFSGYGHTRAIAEKIADLFGESPVPLAGKTAHENSAVILFPVYCQNIPKPVIEFLLSSTFDYVFLIATFGGFCAGNVLKEAQKAIKGIVVGGATLPTAHTFINENFDADIGSLPEIIKTRTENRREIEFPREYKNPFANLFPAFRSRLSVKITKSSACTNCGICDSVCPTNAIKNGKIGKNCIRCLSCVAHCPAKALSFTVKPILKHYLSGKRNGEIKVY